MRYGTLIACFLLLASALLAPAGGSATAPTEIASGDQFHRYAGEALVQVERRNREQAVTFTGDLEILDPKNLDDHAALLGILEGTGYELSEVGYVTTGIRRIDVQGPGTTALTGQGRDARLTLIRSPQGTVALRGIQGAVTNVSQSPGSVSAHAKSATCGGGSSWFTLSTTADSGTDSDFFDSIDDGECPVLCHWCVYFSNKDWDYQVERCSIPNATSCEHCYWAPCQ